MLNSGTKLNQVKVGKVKGAIGGQPTLNMIYKTSLVKRDIRCHYKSMVVKAIMEKLRTLITAELIIS